MGEEKGKNRVLYAIIIIVAALLIYTIASMLNNSTKTATNNNPAMSLQGSEDEASFETIATGSTSLGDVLIELTPHSIQNGKLAVDIRANTHSISLNDFNLKDITRLYYSEKDKEDSKIVEPVDVPKLSGHHSSGTLVFSVDKNISSFTIKITGIPKVDERVFKW